MRPLPGSPAVSSQLMSHPDRLARALGRALRDFHDRGIGDCPFSNSAADMLARVERNHRARELDEVMARAIGETDIDRIYERIRAGARLLEDDVVVHGDFCLPNVFFDGEYRFAGFIDLGMAGRGIGITTCTGVDGRCATTWAPTRTGMRSSTRTAPPTSIPRA